MVRRVRSVMVRSLRVRQHEAAFDKIWNRADRVVEHGATAGKARLHRKAPRRPDAGPQFKDEV